MSDPILAQLQRDLILRPLVQHLELPPLQSPRDVYVALLRSIISQQLSTKAADTIYGRFMGLFPRSYPTPRRLLQLSEADLRGVGLSRQKAQYVTNVARFTLREKLRSLDWSTYSDAGIMDFLGQIKGVGPWTVQMILLFSLGRPDVFPVKDLIIAQSMVKLYGVEAQGRAQLARLEAIAEAWRPYRSTACRYLWRWHDQKKET
ncbi:MAG: DNA-3-methyladenine glycosylase 2 family protein [Bacteroidota bacterium]